MPKGCYPKSEKHKLALSLAARERYKDKRNHPRYGAVASLETKEKLRQGSQRAWSRKGKNYWTPEGAEKCKQSSKSRQKWSHTADGLDKISQSRTKFRITKAELEDLYQIQNLEPRQIALLYKVSPATVHNKFEKLDIKYKGKSGSRNSNWKGGISKSPYPEGFTNKLKWEIKKRDGFACQLCLPSSTRTKLHIHHIDFDKNNINTENLISLCPRHHSAVNARRGQLIQTLLSQDWKGLVRIDLPTPLGKFDL